MQLRYASALDYVYILFAILAALVAACGWPAFTLVNGAVIDAFVQFELANNGTNPGHADVQRAFMRHIYLYSGLQLLDAILYMVATYGTLYCFQLFALRQVNAIKRKYFESILRAEVAWHDRQSSGQIASRIAR